MVIITPIFILLLFVTAFDFGVVHTVGNSGNVKKILSDSGVYNSVVPDALAQAKSVTNGNNSIPLTNPAIQSAAQKAISPQVVQSSAENAIDGIYDWLDGKVPLPDFQIDLTTVKANFASYAAQAAESQAATLPVCTTAANYSDFDAFNATCLPKGVTLDQVGTQVQNNLTNGKGFLEHPVITADSIKSKGTNQSIFASNNFQKIPKKYQMVKKTPYALGAVAVLLAVCIIFLSSTRRKGLRHVGVLLLIIGLFMLVFACGLNYAVNQKALPKLNGQLNNAVLEKDIKLLAKDITQSIDKNYWIFGGVYAALGAIAIGTVIFTGRGKKTKAAAAPANHTPHQPEPVEDSEPEAKTEPEPKSEPEPKPQPEPKHEPEPETTSKPATKPSVKKIKVQ